MKFNRTLAKVYNRGRPPVSYLRESVLWCASAPDEIFAPNSNKVDVYADIEPILGPWLNLLHRRGAWLEMARVVAGFESTWNFNCGVDLSNKYSRTHKEAQETGIFQVSFDSTRLNKGAMMPFAVSKGIGTVGSFITQMKSDHALAFEYFARLSRINLRWDGPLIRHEIDKWLSRPAVIEFCDLLTQTSRGDNLVTLGDSKS